MQNKLYVGNLSFKATEDELQKFFESCGNVTEVSIISDRQTGRPKGFAFIHMSNESEAQKALELNGKEFMGRTLQVSEARSEGPYVTGGANKGRPERGRGDYGQGSGTGYPRNW